MTTIQDRRREAENTLNRLTAQREGCIASLVRYEGRLKIAQRKLERLKRACRKALEQVTAAAQMPKPTVAEAPKPEAAKVETPPPVEANTDELDIPGFLRRSKEADKKDAEAAAAIRQEQADLKKAKARGRVETMKAKQRGDTRKMPLTGRAALEAIRQG